MNIGSGPNSVKRKDETRILTDKAFWEVLASGVAPTVDRVNDWLNDKGHGRRDRAVINEELKVCWVKLGERTRGTFALPGVSDEATALFIKLCEDLQAKVRADLQVEQKEIVETAAAQVQAAQRQARDAEQAAEAARGAQRESAAAFDALSVDRERMRSELDDNRQRNEREIARLQELLGEARQQVAGLRAQLDAQEKAHTADREAAAREHRRQALEIDGLRTENKAVAAHVDKLQADLDASLAREREMGDRAREMSAEMGTLRGSERALQQHIKDLQSRADQRDEEVALLRGQLEGGREQLRLRDAELERILEALAASLPLNFDQLVELVAQGWASGAQAPGKAVPATEDEQAVYAERGMRYARRAIKAAGIKIRAPR